MSIAKGTQESRIFVQNSLQEKGEASLRQLASFCVAA
jgi:hypothetical protein